MTAPAMTSTATGYAGHSTECVQDWHPECAYARCACECHETLPPITPRQQAIVSAVTKYIAGNGYGPSLREVAALVGLRSPDTVAYHINLLVGRGLLTKGAGKARALGLPAGGAR